MQQRTTGYRRPLTGIQIELLELVYTFRFVTVELTRNYFADTNPGMDVFRRLETLENQGLIAKGYVDNYHLLHKPVVYYLLPAGLRKLSERRDEDDERAFNVKTIYRDGAMSEPFIQHCLAIFDLYNRLTARYGDTLEFLTKRDQAGLEKLPKHKPDIYAILGSGKNQKHYFIDLFDGDTHLDIEATKKAKRYLAYLQSGEWDILASPLPIIIFVCNTDEACRRVQKRSETTLRRTWLADLTLVTTTRQSITKLL